MALDFDLAACCYSNYNDIVTVIIYDAGIGPGGDPRSQSIPEHRQHYMLLAHLSLLFSDTLRHHTANTADNWK